MNLKTANAGPVSAALKRLREFLRWLVRLGLLGMVGVMVWLLCHRYPTEEEVTEHLNLNNAAVVDGEQRDIGLFQVSEAGKEVFYLETFPQWVFPWQKYEWPQ